ncbi:MAG: metalloregulator ArsR/SmtB family transcription factor [Actinomycetota bacterium]|jgi:DNA-binding transcriptional ArsR family regulator|nr:metalloregulator ArsR/SmtB family transcription factor [Actinomycetota bacterium]
MLDDRCDLLCLDLPRAEALRVALAGERPGRAAAAARALADPTRMTVALALAHGQELCGCDLAYVVERSPALVSHHLKALRSAGLAESRREGRLVLHRLAPAGAALVRVLAGERTTS